jgi:adhesin transport system outer membrane protein
MRLFLLIFSVVCSAVGVAVAADGFTLSDAILMAVQTNPGVGEAAANRRATETELRQNQGTLLPQIRVEASAGPEKTDQKDVRPPLAAVPLGNDTWLYGRKASVVGRQLLFDGFASLNEIWRQAARVDAAAARVHERTELIALDTAEAYIDIIRYTRLVSLAEENVAAHRRILSNVQSRFKGGRAGEGDLQQTNERVEGAQASLADFRRSLEDARAKYRKTVGLEPFNLRVPGRLAGLPATRDEALAVTLTNNPTIKAAQADADAAKFGFHATAGAFMPSVSLEGRLTEGRNTDNIYGTFDQASGKIVASWDIFRGGQDTWKRAEAAERYTEQTMKHARLQRDAFESIDKAWAARTVTQDRIAALTREIGSARKVIDAYSKEYDLGQRSLIDLLNAENQLFNSQVSLVSARGVAVFADYQLLAAMGKLLDYLKAPHPVDAEPMTSMVFGLIPWKLPPVYVHLPTPGPEPLNVVAPQPPTGFFTWPWMSTKGATFSDRWTPSDGTATVAGASWLPQQQNQTEASPAEPSVSSQRPERARPRGGAAVASQSTSSYTSLEMYKMGCLGCSPSVALQNTSSYASLEMYKMGCLGCSNPIGPAPLLQIDPKSPFRSD